MAQNQVEILGRVAETPFGRRIPLFLAGVPAGFPSPADDYIDRHLDLHEHLIEHPAATFYVRASGTSMVQAGIHDGDLLIVDRAIEPRDGHVVIAAKMADGGRWPEIGIRKRARGGQAVEPARE
jgi:DNA polymerase V